MEGTYSFRTVNFMVGDHVLRNGLSRITTNYQNTPHKLLPATSQADGDNSKIRKQGKMESVINTMNKLAKGKLILGAKIMQVGGGEKVFKKIFDVCDGEQLVRSSQCSLFTTAGPIAGRLFISSQKLAFCSDKAIAKYSGPSGEIFRYHYKVVIPLRKIEKANQSENVKKPSKKYLQVVTNDDFEFWFTGFLNCKRTVKCLHQALVEA